MNRNPRQIAPGPRRRSPRLEALEHRSLLSTVAGSPFSAGSSPVSSAELSVTQVDPAPNSIVTQSPKTLTITFNHPFDPASVSVFGDVALEQVKGAGNAAQGQGAGQSVSTLDPSLLSEPTTLTAPTNQLVVTLNAALSPGHYRIELLGSTSTLTAADGAPLAYTSDVSLGDFTVQPAGVGLQQATSLGAVGSSETVQPGTLDFQANPQAVDLYQFTLAPGHFWRFGAEVSATRDGGTLHSALSLFDAHGNPIATSQQGGADFPNDPYLFAGLEPGTYYIGVSGAGDLAGQAGGYNPVTRDPGTVLQTQPGGPFHLGLQAVAEDSPTVVQGLGLNWADPEDNTPTGFTLAFSGEINPKSALTGVVVVDQSARSWPVIPVGYDPSTCQLSFAFDAHLPAGQYTLRLPARGGLTDLAGLAPVAPGEPRGVLGSWTVSPNPVPADPNDLGVLYLPQPGVTGPSPVSGNVSIPAGGSVTDTFVVVAPSQFNATFTSGGASFAVELDAPTGTRTLLSGAGSASPQLLVLQPGSYKLRFDATGAGPAQVNFELSGARQDWLLANGVGQGPALNLIVVAPPIPSFSNQPPLSSSQPPLSTSTAVEGPIPVAGSNQQGPSEPASEQGSAASVGSSLPTPSLASNFGSSAGAAGAVLTLGTPLIGRPTLEADQISAVGPVAASGSTAVSASSAGLLQGINYGPRLGEGNSSTGEGPASVGPDAPTTDNAMFSELIPFGPSLEAPARIAFEGLERLGPVVYERVQSRIPTVDAVAAPLGMVASGIQERIAGTTSAARIARIAMTHDGDVATAEGGQVQQASIRIPIGLGLATLALLRYQRPVRNWLGRSRQGSGTRSGSTTRRIPVPRPHLRLKPAGFAVPCV